jgi:hypothetical protein
MRTAEGRLAGIAPLALIPYHFFKTCGDSPDFAVTCAAAGDDFVDQCMAQ